MNSTAAANFNLQSDNVQTPSVISSTRLRLQTDAAGYGQSSAWYSNKVRSGSAASFAVALQMLQVQVMGGFTMMVSFTIKPRGSGADGYICMLTVTATSLVSRLFLVVQNNGAGATSVSSTVVCLARVGCHHRPAGPHL